MSAIEGTVVEDASSLLGRPTIAIVVSWIVTVQCILDSGLLVYVLSINHISVCLGAALSS
jgi:hypothetical protein